MPKIFINCLTVGSLGTNCWICASHSPPAAAQTDFFCAVIDPGSESNTIIEYLRKNNLAPQYILLTHGHFDHVTALPQLAKAFPDAVTAIHREDASYLETDPGQFLEEGDIVGPLRILHVPGHTPGSVAFHAQEDGVLFSGDTLFRGDRGRTDLPGGSEPQLKKSLARLLAMDGSIRVLPGHGRETTIEKEVSRGLGYFFN